MKGLKGRSVDKAEKNRVAAADPGVVVWARLLDLGAEKTRQTWARAGPLSAGTQCPAELYSTCWSQWLSQYLSGPAIT